MTKVNIFIGQQKTTAKAKSAGADSPG